MEDEIKVRRTCGWEAPGPTDEVVARTQAHGRDLHDMEATSEDVLAWRVVPDPIGPPEAQRRSAELSGFVAVNAVTDLGVVAVAEDVVTEVGEPEPSSTSGPPWVMAIAPRRPWPPTW